MVDTRSAVLGWTGRKGRMDGGWLGVCILRTSNVCLLLLCSRHVCSSPALGIFSALKWTCRHYITCAFNNRIMWRLGEGGLLDLVGDG